jgi:imidazolonepropionase
MITADLIIRDCRQLVTCSGAIPKRNTALQAVGERENASIASRSGTIVFIGDEEELDQNVQPEPGCVTIDARGLTALPGLVDSHTHLPFAGSRENEFKLRIEGAAYLELAEMGMGIQSTVDETRKASRSELTELCLQRMDSMLLHGTTTVEAKSGYGLNLDDEIKQLEALKEADRNHPVEIIPTFMGAHEVPREFKNRKDAYIDLLIKTMIPEIKTAGLAEFFDVFCEKGVYSVEETRRMVRAAKEAGFKIKIHADEFASLGGAQLAAEEGAVSAEHLIAASQDGIKKLAESNTAAVLLPGVPFFLMQEKRAPARAFIDAGAIPVLATDFNPGSSMTESLFFILQLGVFTMHMRLEETLNAGTANAAYAVDRHDRVGSLEPGKQMDVILCDAPNYAGLFYHFGVNPVRHVIKNGKPAVKDGQLI